MAAQAQFTVIIFKELQFRGAWTRSAGTNRVVYTALEKPELMVLMEDHSGNNVTYLFRLKPRDEVWVIYADSQVHIPALCAKPLPGNQIKCEG